MPASLSSVSLGRVSYPLPMPKLATPSWTHGEWNGDPLPLLDAAEAVVRLFEESGRSVEVVIEFGWADGSQHETSFDVARKELRFAAPLDSVRVILSTGLDLDKPPSQTFCSLRASSSFGLSVLPTSEDFELADRVIAAVTTILETAVVSEKTRVSTHEEAPVEKPRHRDDTAEKAAAVGPHPAKKPRLGSMAWVEAHPALTALVASLTATAAIIVIAIATN